MKKLITVGVVGTVLLISAAIVHLQFQLNSCYKMLESHEEIMLNQEKRIHDLESTVFLSVEEFPGDTIQ